MVKMIRPDKKRKGKLKIGRILLAVLLCIACIFLGISAFSKIGFPGRILGQKDAGPSYYLVIGTYDKENTDADLILLVAWNEVNKKVSFISIPPNTQIGRPEGKSVLLNKTYSEGGAEETKSAIENLLHIRIDKYAVFNTSAFENLDTTEKGVNLYVEKDMSHFDKYGQPDINIRKGYQKLDGDQALGYLRFIDAQDGEIGRLQRQERLIKAYIASLQNNPSLYNWVEARYHWDSVDSDITSSEIAKIIYKVSGYESSDFKFIILPGEKQTKNAQKVWVMNPVEAQKISAMTMEQDS